MFWTDRSRMVAFRNCPRLRFLQYHWDGTGLEAVVPSLALVQGIAVHDCFDRILRGEDPEVVIADARETIARELTDRQHPEVDDTGWFIAEQQTLTEGLIRAWVSERLPVLRDQYEFVAVEREIVHELAPEIGQMVRLDLLARERSSGDLFYLEWKTTSSANDEWIKGWEHNTQILANVVAAETVLGERVEGVIIEGLLKSRRVVERRKSASWSGQRIQDSILCYGWAGSGGKYSVGDYVPGLQRVASWTVMPIRQWVETVLTPEQRTSLFCPIPPIRPRREHRERWVRQAVAQEQRIRQGLELLAVGHTEVMDTVFPLNDEHCFRYWGHPCAFEKLCFSRQIEQDPLGSGLYRRRTPHHEAERTDDGRVAAGD